MMTTTHRHNDDDESHRVTDSDDGELSDEELDTVVGGLERPYLPPAIDVTAEPAREIRNPGFGGVVLLLALLVCTPDARAQTGPAELSLPTALEAALSGNLTLAAARQRVAGTGGALLEQRGAFSTQLRASFSNAVQNDAALNSMGDVQRQPAVRIGSYQLAATKQLRSGILLQPALTLSQTSMPAMPEMVTNDADVHLDVVVPLLRDRGGRMTAAPERAASTTYQADLLNLRYTAATTILNATIAYWTYLAAQRSFDVYVSSEERAERLLNETKVLVAAAERPAADLNQLRANLASKRIARHQAQEQLLNARRDLGLLLGWDAQRINNLPPASDEFPAAQPYSPDSAAVERLAQQALATRSDLAAVRRGRESRRILLGAARDELQPRLDLSGSFGYKGLGSGAGMNEFFSPLYQHLPGMNASLAIQYSWPLSHDQERGRWLQRQSDLDQQASVELDLTRSIDTSVRLAVLMLQHAIARAAQADSALDFYRLNLENEKKKYQLDAATLLDVIISEDGLTNTMVEAVRAHAEYAIAVATLRFQSETVLPPGEPLRLDVGRLLQPPPSQ